MAGRVGVQSAHGLGSCFGSSCPGLMSRPGGCRAGRPSPPPMAQPAPRLRVLYVEDNPANQRLMHDIFEDFDTCSLNCARRPSASSWPGRSRRR